MDAIREIVTTLMAIIGACTFARKVVDYCEQSGPT